MSSTPILGIRQVKMTELRVGQRVKFEDPESFDSSIGQGHEARGRIIDVGFFSNDLVKVIQDGKSFGRWFPASEVKPE